ncbi:MAG: hypothetical protein HY902_13275 [Deltaproteobacteria bacterium]|nr:hypothetical protein [Deltaproteobacteria bacterium]
MMPCPGAQQCQDHACVAAPSLIGKACPASGCGYGLDCQSGVCATDLCAKLVDK